MHKLHAVIRGKGALVERHPLTAVRKIGATMLRGTLLAVFPLLPFEELAGTFVCSISTMPEVVGTFCIETLLLVILILCVEEVRKLRIAQAQASGRLQLPQVVQLKISRRSLLFEDLPSKLPLPGLMDGDRCIEPRGLLHDTVDQVHLGKSLVVLGADLHWRIPSLATTKVISRLLSQIMRWAHGS